MTARGFCLLSLFALAACGPFHPPFTEVPRAGAASAPGQATVVFLWPVEGLVPPGYFTFVTSEYRFVGTIAPGTQLRAELPAGDTTLVGWNDVREEAGGAGSRGVVPVLRAHLAKGRTYYVHMVFGEWDDSGAPKKRRGRQWGAEGVMSAMVGVTPTSEQWANVWEWTAKLDALVPDQAAGQAWVDERRESVRWHLGLGKVRYDGLRPEVKRLATLEGSDGVAP